MLEMGTESERLREACASAAADLVAGLIEHRSAATGAAQ